MYLDNPEHLEGLFHLVGLEDLEDLQNPECLDNPGHLVGLFLLEDLGNLVALVDLEDQSVQ